MLFPVKQPDKNTCWQEQISFDRNTIIVIKRNSWQACQLAEKLLRQEPGTGAKYSGWPFSRFPG